MQRTKKINYKGWTLQGIEFTPYKKEPFWEVHIFDKYDIPLRHKVRFIDTWTKRKTSDVFWTSFKGWDDAKNFVDSIEAPSSEMYSNSKFVNEALSKSTTKFPKDVDYYI